jgi:hypothetical protein
MQAAVRRPARPHNQHERVPAYQHRTAGDLGRALGTACRQRRVHGARKHEALLTEPIDFSTLRNEMNRRVEGATQPAVKDFSGVATALPDVADWPILLKNLLVETVKAH